MAQRAYMFTGSRTRSVQRTRSCPAMVRLGHEEPVIGIFQSLVGAERTRLYGGDPPTPLPVGLWEAQGHPVGRAGTLFPSGQLTP